MIAVFIGFAFAGMPLVAQLGVACAVAIAVDATVVRLVLVPALMAMFDRWNWWLPGWLDRLLPSVDFDRPLPKLDIGDLVVIPDDISALAPPLADLRMVVRNAARLKELAPDTVSIADPMAFTGCSAANGNVGELAAAGPLRLASRRSVGQAAGPPGDDVAGRLAVALDALETEAAVARRTPVETTTVQLPTGDRLQIPTCAETLRMKGFLALCPQHPDRLRRTGGPGRRGRRRECRQGAGQDRRVLQCWTTRATVDCDSAGSPAGRSDSSEAPDDGRWSGPDGDARWDDVRQAVPVARCGDHGGGELTRPYQRVDGTPVEFWPTASIREALHSGDIAVWQRIVGRSNETPYGRTARQVEEVLQSAAPTEFPRHSTRSWSARGITWRTTSEPRLPGMSGSCWSARVSVSRNSPPGSVWTQRISPPISTRR